MCLYDAYTSKALSLPRLTGLGVSTVLESRINVKRRCGCWWQSSPADLLPKLLFTIPTVGCSSRIDEVDGSPTRPASGHLGVPPKRSPPECGSADGCAQSASCCAAAWTWVCYLPSAIILSCSDVTCQPASCLADESRKRRIYCTSKTSPD